MAGMLLNQGILLYNPVTFYFALLTHRGLGWYNWAVAWAVGCQNRRKRPLKPHHYLIMV